MKLDIFQKHLQKQLEALYSTAPNWWDDDFKEGIYGFGGLYAELYDYLVSEGHPIGLKQLEQKEKDRLWALANKKYKADHGKDNTLEVFTRELREAKVENYKEVAAEKTKERQKKDLHVIYKSFIVRKYLLDKVKTEGALLLTVNDIPLRELM